jgi:hypothetical protein
LLEALAVLGHVDHVGVVPISERHSFRGRASRRRLPAVLDDHPDGFSVAIWHILE